MSSSDQRDNERVPTFLRVRLRFADVDTFIEKYSTNVSLGGVFIQSRSPKPPGSALKFELALENGEVLIKGEGQVTWVREFDANAPGQPFGMGVRFTNLDAKSRALVERAVAHRQTRGAGEPTPSTFAPAGGKPASRPPARSAAHTPPLSPPAPSTASPAARSAPVANADAALDALMREAGLDSGKIARATARAAAGVAREPSVGALGALLHPRVQPSGSVPPPAPVPGPKAPAVAAALDEAATPGEPEPAGDTSEDIAIAAAPSNASDSEEFGSHEVPDLPEADIDEMLGGFKPTPPPVPMSADGRLLDTDLEIESLAGPPMMDAGSGRGSVEITAVGTPPRFDESPESEPLVFPDREVTTPPPEAATALFAADTTNTPADVALAEGPASDAEPAAPVNAADRWAAATGPESATLEADLVAALDAVIDHSQDAAPRRPTAPPASDTSDGAKKKKGILGRIFRKKG